MDKTTTNSFLTRWLSGIGKTSPATKAMVGILAGTGLVALLYLIYSLLFLGKVFPGVMLGSQNFAGLNRSQVTEKVTALVNANKANSLKLVYQDKTYTISADDVSLAPDIEKTAEVIYGFGRNDGAFKAFFQQVSAVFVRHRLHLVAQYDTDLLDHKIADATDQVDQPPVNATAVFKNDELVFTKEKAGTVINRDQLKTEIYDRLTEFSTDSITLNPVDKQPSIVLGDEAAIRSKVDQLLQQALVLTWPNGKKTFKQQDLKSLIGFVGQTTAGLTADPTSTPGPLFLAPAYTVDKIKDYLRGLASTVDVPAKEPKLIIKNGALAISQTAKEGIVIDINPSAEAVSQAIAQDRSPTVALVMKTDSPVITENNLANLGIKERIGLAETNFVGSPANRKANIVNGVSILQSALVKPGDEFSTVKTLGAVDDTTGFLPELVIKENKTTPEFGGGLCQVSTTLFRSVLNAGLKVTERQNHSYRVSYYEPPVGLDATIYLPKPDFRFLNDTGHHILIQGRVEGNKVIFELWGTSDGRTSSISDPTVTNITNPPEPVYVDTDTLPKGEQKQIEKAHQGATAVITYTVTRNGQPILKQVFKSIYKAWGAKYLVGTHEDSPPPAPTDTPTPSS